MSCCSTPMRPRPQFEVLKSVVLLIGIPVMNLFRGKQGSSKREFHDMPVLFYIPAPDSNVDIALGVDYPAAFPRGVLGAKFLFLPIVELRG